MNDMSMKPPPGGDPLGTTVLVLGVLVTLLTFVLAFRATFWPHETAADHPKRSILKDDR